MWRVAQPISLGTHEYRLHILYCQDWAIKTKFPWKPLWPTRSVWRGCWRQNNYSSAVISAWVCNYCWCQSLQDMHIIFFSGFSFHCLFSRIVTFILSGVILSYYYIYIRLLSYHSLWALFASCWNISLLLQCLCVSRATASVLYCRCLQRSLMSHVLVVKVVLMVPLVASWVPVDMDAALIQM